MKIAIVCGHFIPELGYLEVHLARALSRLNHEVAVVTSSAVPAYVKSKVTTIPHTGEQNVEGIRIIRLKPFLALGQLVWCNGVRKSVEAIQPDLVIAIGLGKVFPKPILRSGTYKLAVLLGDNTNTYTNMNGKQRFIQRVIKKPVYEKALSTANSIFSYTPETVSVLKGWISKNGVVKLEEKNTFISLGFDPSTFFFNPDLRRQGREELNLENDEILLISVARMGANKDYSDLVRSISDIVKGGMKVSCLLVGIGDDEYSAVLKKQIAQSGVAHRFITKPFSGRSELNRLYNAADIGYWPITAISIYEGLGTGLFILVPPSGSLSHLQLDGRQGQFVNEDLEHSIRTSLNNYNRTGRDERVNESIETFSYQSIANKLLETVKSV